MTQISQGDSGRYTDEDIDNKARDLVRFFLATSSRKLPIKRQEIMEKVMKDMSRAFNITLEKARVTMKNTFGLDIVPLEQPNKTFCVVNLLELESTDPHLTWGDTDNQHAALLMIILSIILMAGDVIGDDDLWKALKHLGLDYEKPDNEVFGDVKKLVTQEFVQQGYIVYSKLPETDPAKYEFKWGTRAQLLTTKDDVLSFVCQIYDQMEMFEWPIQYDAIHGEGAAAAAKAAYPSASQSQESSMETD
ncbi:non-structural maintenance of chromosomes element 3 homolog [Watersipora subatra]|uniref:non-structural maintenance of chromosomes element 3 homolog n=1 Tax=Watersipora subatra TaxID=2589382 RepID=UPI00355B2299